MPSPVKSLFAGFSILFLFSFFLPASACCGGEPIARLTNFTGIVLINSRGEWAVKPVKNLPLYSQDKVLTRIGAATITFSDGATLDIKNNSNLLIYERETEEGLVKKVKTVHRHILLFLGKMFFKTGTGQVQTQFETDKAVIGIRGTAGILSIGADGQIYITFTEGGAKLTLGDLLYNQIAEDVPTEIADQNPIQKAAYQAHAAWEKCLEARRKAAKGEISSVQELWVCAKAREMAARELTIWAKALAENNPYAEVVDWADEMIEDANELIEDSIKEQKDAIDQGATSEPEEEYKPPEEVVEAEAYEPPEAEGVVLPEPPIQDLQQDYTEEIPSAPAASPIGSAP
jgi:hypothetical protein